MANRAILMASLAASTLASVASAQAPPQLPPPLPPSAPQMAPPAQGVPPQAAPVPSAPPGYAPVPGEAPPAAAYPGAQGQWRYAVPGPMELRYYEGRAVPPGYHVETRVRKGLVVAGSIVAGVPYFLSLSVAASSKADQDRWLYLPIAGPFVDLANRKDDCTTNVGSFGPGSTSTYCNDDSSQRFFLMADGLMQVGGTAMLILGLALPSTVLVRDDAPYVGSSGSQFTWSIAPRSFGRSGLGMGLGGTF